MKLEFKITTWETLDIDTKHRDVILEKIKNNELTNSCDVIDFINEMDPNCTTETEINLECIEQIPVNKNNGFSTIVVYDDNSIEIEYENGN